MDKKTEIYREKMIDAATNVILTKMEELRGDREELKELKRRRWVWELIQNANDCCGNKTIDIFIQTNDNCIVFSHNGNCFTFQNMVDLITQISTKRKDDEKVGKFGTGFIATHLLSSKVRIKGFYHSDIKSDKYKKMDLLLDRSGENYKDICQAINNAFDELDNLGLAEEVSYIDSGMITTSFCYEYDFHDVEVNEAVTKGFEDWEKTIPLVMVFAKNIGTVTFNDISVKKEILQGGSENVKTFEIRFTKLGNIYKREYVTVISNSDMMVDVACVASNKDGKWRIEEMQNYPKLFCTFPLIGTENFTFPVAINSKKFHVSQERNDILESVEENKIILEEALNLYRILIETWISVKPYNFFNLCNINNNSTRSVYLAAYENRVKHIYKHAKIVPVIDNFGNENLSSLYEGEEKNVFIPYYEKEKRLFWKLFGDFFERQIPREEEVEYWGNVCSENVIDLVKLTKRVINNEKIQSDVNRIGNEKYLEAINILNRLCFDNQKHVFIKDMKFLNQKFEFEDSNKLMLDESDDELKDILLSFGKDIRKKLLHKEIQILDRKQFETYGNQNIANDICLFVRKKLADESNGCQRTVEDQNIFNQLTDWFINNADDAKILFVDVYEKQHLLTQPEETIRRLKLANQVEDIMNENNIDIFQLTNIVNQSAQLLAMIEQGKLEISPELKQVLKHVSSPNYYSKEIFDRMLERSIINVYKELSKNPYYKIPIDIAEWKKNRLSSTVFTAEKEQKEIQIVIRPSDGKKIIFFEDTEFEALDDCECELWTDNGSGKVMMITLGDLLKTTGVTSIPLKKII